LELPVRKHRRKAAELLESSRADLSARRFNSAASRAYYSIFHLAIAWLMVGGVQPDAGGKWSHPGTQARLRSSLVQHGEARVAFEVTKLWGLRIRGDYEADSVTSTGAAGSVRTAAQIIEAARRHESRLR
jgi:uncharacterized protein (UPF0332 family)